MKRIVLKIVLIVLFIVLLSKSESKASINASNKTVNSGGTVSISVISDIPVVSYKVTMNSSGGLNFVSSSGGTGAGGYTITNASATGMTSLATYTFTAPNVAEDTNFYVSFNASAMEDANLTPVSPDSTTAKITVKAIATQQQTTPDSAVVDTKPATNPGNTSAQKPAPVKTKVEEKKSSEASLKELTVEEGKISPEFSGNVSEYKINVPNEIVALKITATPLDNKAKVTIEGNENFVVGENKVTIKVIAEDGTTKEYVINVIRKRTNLTMQHLKITYIDKDGNVQELELNPKFDGAILEYKLDDISYLINSLNIEAKANLEGATIEISGNDNLQEGENVITIKLTMKAEKAAEGEEQEEDEVIIYTISVNKEKEPTLWEKIKDKFKGIFGGIFTWYNNNIEKIVVYALAICIVSLVGLSVYIVIDYKKYKTLIAKLSKIEQINSSELAIETPTVETPIEEDVQIMEEGMEQEENIPSKKGGKHF